MGLYENYPALISDYVKTDDARANIFWFHKLIDPELFVNDYLTDYAIFYEATGTFYLYSWASHIIDPFLLEKLLPIAMLPICGIFLFLIGNHLSGPYTGLVFGILFVLFPNHNEFFNAGYSRIFAFPGAIIFIYLLLSKRLQHLIWFLPLVALFYPIVFLLNATCYGFWIAWQLIVKKSPLPIKKILLYFTLSMTLSALVILPKYANHHPQFGQLLNYQQLIDNSGAYQHGRNYLLPPHPISHNILKELSQPFVLLALLIIVLTLGLSFFKTIPSEFLLYLVSGILLYELAYLLLLKLYFPYKYFIYSFSLILFFIISYGLGKVIDKLPQQPDKLAALAGLLVVAFIFYGHTLKAAKDMDDYSDKSFFYQYINTLPKISLLAAPPYLADDIPLFAARAVLFSHELASPWFTHYGETIKHRISDFYYAYYSDKRSDLYQFMKKYKVTHLIVDKADFRRLQRSHFYINPYNDLIKQRVRENRGQFYLAANMERLALFEWQDYIIIAAEQLKENL